MTERRNAPWLPVAAGEIGVVEIPGGEHNPRVLEYHLCAALLAADDETPWCSSFICWVMAQCGIDHPRSAWARDWLRWGVECAPWTPGAIVVLRRGEGGHVGIYVGPPRECRTLALLGANQANCVCVQVYDAVNVLGWRWGHIA